MNHFISFHFVYSPADQYRPSQGCHLFNVAQSFQFLLYLVIGKSCRDEAISYFMFFFHLVFLDFKCICKVQFLSHIPGLTTVGHPEIDLLSSLLYSVYFVSQYTLCM